MARVLEVPGKKKLISYRYEATVGRGRAAKGTIKATSEVEAERLLIARGFNPINVEVVPSMFSLEEALPTFFRVKPREVIIFSRQLATLLKSGISLMPALDIMRGQATTSRPFKKMLEGIVNDLHSGGSFSQAIAKHPKVFTEVYSRTIAVGEQTGNLETVLNRLADYLEREGATAKKVKGAMTYPIIVLVAGVVVSIVLMVAVMPQLLGIFTAMSVQLPLPTRILVGVSGFLTSNWLYLILVGAILGAVVLWLMKLPAGRRRLDRLRLTAPIIGAPTLLTEMARFCRTTSVLIGAGLSLQEIMELMPQSSNNMAMRDALERVKEGLLLGEGLSEPLSRIDLFPPLLVQMVAVGEESNTLDFTVGVVADFYESAAEEKTSAMVGMIGPLSTIGIALLVGFIAVSVLMPMYTITGAFG